MGVILTETTSLHPCLSYNDATIHASAYVLANMITLDLIAIYVDLIVQSMAIILYKGKTFNVWDDHCSKK